jgi:hypothetical protein
MRKALICALSRVLSGQMDDAYSFLVDDRHKALAAWAEERRRLESAPNLITIDHHTDTIEAFHGHAFCLSPDDTDAEEAVRNVNERPRSPENKKPAFS